MDKKTARYERQAIRNYLQRQIKACTGQDYAVALKDILAWVLSRQKRYDKKAGGL